MQKTKFESVQTGCDTTRFSQYAHGSSRRPDTRSYHLPNESLGIYVFELTHHAEFDRYISRRVRLQRAGHNSTNLVTACFYRHKKWKKKVNYDFVIIISIPSAVPRGARDRALVQPCLHSSEMNTLHHVPIPLSSIHSVRLHELTGVGWLHVRLCLFHVFMSTHHASSISVRLW